MATDRAADNDEAFKCSVCLDHYTIDTIPEDRRPMIVCGNGHTLCAVCLQTIRRANPNSICPTCRKELMTDNVINRGMISSLQERLKWIQKVQMIKFSELLISARSIAGGGYADIFEAEWGTRQIAIKIIRNSQNQPNQIKAQVHFEASLAMRLSHPNIVRTFGLFENPHTGVIGIVMELADRGSLEKFIGLQNNDSNRLSDLQKVKVALHTVEGLTYLHSMNVAHRDLKPDNILLFGLNLEAKIADFGVSRFLQSTLVKSSAMIGTPKYTAPELLRAGIQYTFTVDIFSISMVFFELFTDDRIEAHLGNDIMQILIAMAEKKRPLFRETVLVSPLVSAIKNLIERGWAETPSERTTLDEFRSLLHAQVCKYCKLN